MLVIPITFHLNLIIFTEDHPINVDKLCSISEAVKKYVHDGSSVVLGAALENAIPFAVTHELIRQSLQNLNRAHPQFA